MPTPKEILRVPRPVNTYVRPYGKDKDRYEVVAKAGCTYTNANGKSITVARSGRVIGRIIDNEFVAYGDVTVRLGKLIQTKIGRKTWANVDLCVKLGRDLLDQLRAVFHYEDAYAIFSIGIARVCCPGIINDDLYQEFSESMLSEHYPFVGLCPNSVCRLLNRLGKSTELIDQFFSNRVSQMVIYEDGTPKSSVIVDGTLVTSYSKVNSFADFSYKARQRGATEFNLLIALSENQNEPVCIGLYRGNQTDTINCLDFLEKNFIVEGFLVIDKGFSIRRIAEYLASHPRLHYLKPLNRNSAIIRKYGLYSYEKPLDFNDHILGRKVKCEEADVCIDGREKYLYSFKDLDRASNERIGWVTRAKKNKKFSHDAMMLEEEEFGTIVFESDVDMKLEDAWLLYRRRWGIETMMEFYKGSNDLNDTRVHDDYSLIGSEFCNFIAMVLIYKILNYLDSKELRENCTYRRIMKMLGTTHKRKDRNGEWVLEPCTKGVAELLDSLDLITDKERKALFPANVGRPIEYDDEPTDGAKETPDSTAEAKRGPGRPKGSKNKDKSTENSDKDPAAPKRKPGRPKGSKNKPKKDNGEASDLPKESRKPGRPKGSKNKVKTSQEGVTANNAQTFKDIEGEPNEPNDETAATSNTSQRKPGRPKGSKNKDKSTGNSYKDPAVPKRKPGRPKGSKNKKNPDSKDKDFVNMEQRENTPQKNEQSESTTPIPPNLTQNSQTDGIKAQVNIERGVDKQIFNKEFIDSNAQERNDPPLTKDDCAFGDDLS